MSIVFTIIGAVFEIYLLDMFYSKFGSRKFTIKVHLFLCTILTLFHSLNSICLVENGLIFFASMLCSILFGFLINIKLAKKVIIGLAFTIILALSEMIAVMITSIGLNYDITQIHSNILLYTIIAVLSRFLSFSILKIISISPRNIKTTLSFWFHLGIYILPICSIFIIVLLYQYCFMIDDTIYQVCTLIASCILVVANIAIIQIMEKQGDYIITKERLQFAESQIKTQAEHYTELYEQQKTLKKFRHDSKNIYISLLSKTSTLPADKVSEYLKEKMEILFDESHEFDSGNPFIDAILQTKATTAQNHQIEIHALLKLAPQISMDEMDLGVLIGAALDNAIEATAKISNPCDRIIKLRIISSDEMLGIEISNPTTTIIDLDNIQTTKTNKENHGYGLKSIKSIAEKYGGILQLSYEDDLFVLSTALVNKESNRD